MDNIFLQRTKPNKTYNEARTVDGSKHQVLLPGNRNSQAGFEILELSLWLFILSLFLLGMTRVDLMMTKKSQVLFLNFQQQWNKLDEKYH